MDVLTKPAANNIPGGVDPQSLRGPRGVGLAVLLALAVAPLLGRLCRCRGGDRKPALAASQPINKPFGGEELPDQVELMRSPTEAEPPHCLDERCAAPALTTATIPKRLSVNYFINRQCNYSCGFCFHTAKNSDMLTLEEAQYGLRVLHGVGMVKINFAGGEPFLHKEFLGALVRFCKQGPCTVPYCTVLRTLLLCGSVF